MAHRTLQLISALLLAVCCAGTPAAQEAPTTGSGLSDALRSAATEHPAIKSRLAELQALGSDLQSAQYQRLPTLSLQAQTMSSDQHQVVAVVQQPLWVGGRISGRINQAEVKQHMGRTALLATQRQVLENTAAAYAVLRGAQQRLHAAELNVAEHEKLKGLISRRQQGGIASNADMLLAESRLSQAVSQRIHLQGAVARARNELLALTQLPVAAHEPVPEQFLILPGQATLADTIVTRSALVAERLLGVEQAEVAMRLEAADMMPALYAKVEQDIYSANNYATSAQNTRVGLVLQGSVEGLGLSGGKSVSAANSRVQSARKDVLAARNDVRRQAVALLIEVESLQQVQRSNEVLVMSTAETLASFMRQYDAGRKSWVDVLNAQREFSDARLALEQARSSLQEALLRLAAQLGNLDTFTGGAL